MNERSKQIWTTHINVRRQKTHSVNSLCDQKPEIKYHGNYKFVQLYARIGPLCVQWRPCMCVLDLWPGKITLYILMVISLVFYIIEYEFYSVWWYVVRIQHEYSLNVSYPQLKSNWCLTWNIKHQSLKVLIMYGPVISVFKLLYILDL